MLPTDFTINMLNFVAFQSRKQATAKVKTQAMRLVADELIHVIDQAKLFHWKLKKGGRAKDERITGRKQEKTNPSQ